MEDKEVLEAVRGIVAERYCRDCESNSFCRAEDLSMPCATAKVIVKDILSLRGNIVDGKFIPDEKGRYGFEVVDYLADFGCEIAYQLGLEQAQTLWENYPNNFNRGMKRIDSRMRGKGFAHIVGG